MPIPRGNFWIAGHPQVSDVAFVSVNRDVIPIDGLPTIRPATPFFEPYCGLAAVLDGAGYSWTV
jgi:hypothetical protein